VQCDARGGRCSNQATVECKKCGNLCQSCDRELQKDDSEDSHKKHYTKKLDAQPSVAVHFVERDTKFDPTTQHRFQWKLVKCELVEFTGTFCSCHVYQLALYVLFSA
jgi:hypothetical protein